MVCQCDQMLGEELWKIWNLKGKRLNPGKFFLSPQGFADRPSHELEQRHLADTRKSFCGKYDKKIFKDFRNILETDKCKGIESGRDNGHSGGVPLARDCCGEFPRQ